MRHFGLLLGALLLGTGAPLVSLSSPTARVPPSRADAPTTIRSVAPSEALRELKAHLTAAACAPWMNGTCPDNATSENEDARCEAGYDTYNLQFYDDYYGPGSLEDTYEEADETLACIGAHDACSQGCTLEGAQVIHPDAPAFNSAAEYIDCLPGGSCVDGYVWWNENSELAPGQNPCDPNVEECWDDVLNGQYESGTSDDYYYWCDSSGEQPRALPSTSKAAEGPVNRKEADRVEENYV